MFKIISKFVKIGRYCHTNILNSKSVVDVTMKKFLYTNNHSEPVNFFAKNKQLFLENNEIYKYAPFLMTSALSCGSSKIAEELLDNYIPDKKNLNSENLLVQDSF